MVEDLPAIERQVAGVFEPGHFPARMTATTQVIDADCLVMVDGMLTRQARR